MKIEALQAFVAVAEQRSFSRASERLYLSQPTVSRLIAELERTMGDALFVRNAHTCELTLLGKQVFVHAKRMLNEWESIEDLARQYVQRDDASICIGYTYQEMLPIITRALSEMNGTASKLELSVRFGEGGDVVRLLREGELDCAVMHLPSVTNPEGLEIRQICKCNMRMMVPIAHHLAKHDSVTLEQFCHETDVRITGERTYYAMVDEAFRSMNLPLMKHVYVRNAADCMPIAGYHQYICISTSLYPAWSGFKSIPISDWTTDFSFVFLARSGQMTQTAEKLYRALKDSVKEA